jgi:hypothetical protein
VQKDFILAFITGRISDGDGEVTFEGLEENYDDDYDLANMAAALGKCRDMIIEFMVSKGNTEDEVEELIFGADNNWPHGDEVVPSKMINHDNQPAPDSEEDGIRPKLVEDDGLPKYVIGYSTALPGIMAFKTKDVVKIKPVRGNDEEVVVHVASETDYQYHINSYTLTGLKYSNSEPIDFVFENK